jgi:hypothetical protein
LGYASATSDRKGGIVGGTGRSQTKKAKALARERVAQLRAEQQRRERRRRFLVTAVFGLVAAVIIAGGLWAVLSKRSSEAMSGVQTFKGLSREHVQGKVSYPQTPPVGGNHNSVPLNCGTYTTPVPNENAVHSLEHGAVWITYRPDLPAADVALLTKVASGKSYVNLSPYPNLPAPVVASAWGLQLKVPSAADHRITKFISKYAQGPQTPEPGALCSGGVGTSTS